MSASAPTVNIDIDSDDEDDAELPLIDAFDASRINNPLSNNRSMSELTEGLVEIQRVLSAYTDTLRDRTGSTYHTDAIMWVYRERYQGGTIHQPYPNAPVVLLFNWVQQHDTIRTLSPLRADIKNGAPRAMRLLYSIGKWFLNADVTIPMPTSRKPTTTYQTSAFQPQTFPLHQSELDGLYTSTVTSVMTYFDFFEQLYKINHAIRGPGDAPGFHGVCRAEAAPALRLRMDAGRVATGPYRSPDGNQHHRRVGPLSYPRP
jgi:hypothetical protein